jgi:hypothetical protein
MYHQLLHLNPLISGKICTKQIVLSIQKNFAQFNGINIILSEGNNGQLDSIRIRRHRLRTK